MKKTISAPDAPKAIGPYSHAVRAGDFLYISGQLPIVAETGAMAGPAIADQTNAALRNLDGILKEAGFSRNDVIKTTIFLADLANFETVNKTYADYFQGCDFPARSTVQVAKLPKGSPIEIEAVAYRKS